MSYKIGDRVRVSSNFHGGRENASRKKELIDEYNLLLGVTGTVVARWNLGPMSLSTVEVDDQFLPIIIRDTLLEHIYLADHEVEPV